MDKGIIKLCVCTSVQVLVKMFKPRISVTLVFWSGFRFLDQYFIFLSRCKWGADLATCPLSWDMTEILLKRLKTLFQSMYHLRKKPVLWRNIQCHPRSAVYTLLWHYLWLTLHRKWQKCSLLMVMSDKYSRPWSNAGYYVWRLTKAYNICPSIRQYFANFITYVF